MSRRFCRDDDGAVIFRLAEAVEDAAEDVRRDGQLERLGQEADGGALDVDAPGTLEDLEEDLVVLDLEDLAVADGAVAELDIYDVAVLGLVNHFDQYERTGDVRDGLILFYGQHFVLLILADSNGCRL